MEDCTVPEPEVFNQIPREGVGTTRKPSVITVEFGGGYEQRRAGGLNADLRTFKPVLRVTGEYSRTAPDSFLSHHARMHTFLWHPPKYNRTARVIYREWSISDNAIYIDFNCTFEEVIR